MLCTTCNEKKSIVQEEKDFGLCEGCLKFIDSDIQTIQSLDIQPHACYRHHLPNISLLFLFPSFPQYGVISFFS